MQIDSRYPSNGDNYEICGNSNIRTAAVICVAHSFKDCFQRTGSLN